MTERVMQCEENVIERIRRHPLFQSYYKRLEQAEQDRHQSNVSTFEYAI